MESETLKSNAVLKFSGSLSPAMELYLAPPRDTFIVECPELAERFGVETLETEMLGMDVAENGDTIVTFKILNSLPR